MVDLIDRAWLRSYFEQNPEADFSSADVVRTIDYMPTVEAEPVVRCKDCIEGDYPEEECGVMMYLCPLAGKRVRADFYCADGTRRMDADAINKEDHDG